MEELDLAPCPRCGKDAFVTHDFGVWCVQDRCLTLPPRPDRASAIAAWNTRPAPPKVASDAEEMCRPRMSGGEWRALPENARRYIHMLETDCDPSGTIRSEMILRDQVEDLERDRNTRACANASLAVEIEALRQELEAAVEAHERIVSMAGPAAGSSVVGMVSGLSDIEQVSRTFLATLNTEADDAE